MLLDLADQVRERGYYVAADDPQAGLPGFWERLWTASEKRALDFADLALCFASRRRRLTDAVRLLTEVRFSYQTLTYSPIEYGTSAIFFNSAAFSSGWLSARRCPCEFGI